MAAPTRPPRTRASGGRALMLLGVLLALAAGLIVIFIVSQATSTTTQTVTVVVALQDLPANTILTVNPSDAAHTNISEAFTTKQVSSDFVPKDAYTFTSTDALNIQLNDNVVVGTFYAGEILRTSDPRLSKLGTSAAAGSYTNLNPGQLKDGQVLMTVSLTAAGGGNSKPFAVAGDHIDMLVTECNLVGSKDPTGCETQTTFQNVYVYATTGPQIIVVVSHADALSLKYLMETGKLEIVLRHPGDTSKVTTAPVDANSIVTQFSY